MNVAKPLVRRLAAGLAALGLVTAQAQAACTSDAMIVFDGSHSMSFRATTGAGGPRIDDARDAIARAIPRAAELRRVGLVTYGPGDTARGQQCWNVNVAFPPVVDAALRVNGALAGLIPAGPTPLTQAVWSAANVLDYATTPGEIVLVTDGQETCGGDPCALGARLAAEAADMTVHVIGFRVRAPYFDWESGEGAGHVTAPIVADCLAEATGGIAVSTDTVAELADALAATLGCPLIGRRAGPRRAG